MAIREEKLSEGEYYHVFVRGAHKQPLFLSKRDYVRFLFYILFFQADLSILNIGRQVTEFIKKGAFDITPEIVDKIIKERNVELVNFSFMPNHIHLILREIVEGGISKMMQKVLTGFTRYSHVKYGKTGHIFEGPFRAVHIKDNIQILYLSAYIHKNPKELKGWQDCWEYYPWSSHQDFIDKNRWGGLLANKIILEQFSNKKEYARFVRESSAKEIKDSLDPDLLTTIDRGSNLYQ